MDDQKLCSIEGCGKPSKFRGWCNSHYIRWQRHGDPNGGGVSRHVGRVCSVSGCIAKHHSHGYCANHEQAFRKYGNPLFRVPIAKPTWISEHVKYSGDECLKWPFANGEDGRGCGGSFGEKRITAARAMCIAAHGEPPTPRHQAAHSCGKGHEGCVNPKHLRWATGSENALDRNGHGTMRRGTTVNTSKLTELQVADIKRRIGHETGASLAKEFGVSTNAISAIKKNRAWSWMKG